MPAAAHEKRLLQLATWILSQGGPVTRADAFARFPKHYKGKPDSKEKMFQRDKDALKDLGFHLETEEVGGPEQVGYTIEPHSSMLQPIELAPDEAAAAWTAGVAALRLSSHPMRSELESALRKLVLGTKGLPPRAAATEELAPDAEPDAARFLKTLVEGWEARTRVRIGYWRIAENRVVERDVDVYGWARRRGEWIFVGHCHLRKAVRIFYLSRVRSLEKRKAKGDEAKARAARGRKGDYDIPADFDVRAWSRQQVWDYDVHPPRPATVRFRGSLAALAPNLLPGAEVRREPDGARLATVSVRHLGGLVRQALAWGPEAELVAPPEGRAMARGMLAAAISGPAWGEP